MQFLPEFSIKQAVGGTKSGLIFGFVLEFLVKGGCKEAGLVGWEVWIGLDFGR